MRSSLPSALYDIPMAAVAQQVEYPLATFGPNDLSTIINGGVDVFAVPNADVGAGSYDGRLSPQGGPDYSATRANSVTSGSPFGVDVEAR